MKLLSLSILDQHLIALGKTGAGKSYALRGLIEMLLNDGRRVCIVDPKGDHWGIKSSADGKHPGYPVVIFGGDHADVPINPRVGKEVAELVATGNRPCVIDFRGWMPSDRTRFWIDFASTLFRNNRLPLWLAIDEVHNFAPQGKVLDPEAGKCLHWTNRLASEGRGLGVRLLMASQRPQKVHKDTVTAAETLVAMRVIHKLDRDAIKDWIDGCGDPERGKMVMNSLAEMKRGEAFVWSPEVGFFERLKFPTIKTFDSFKAPTGDEKQEAPKGWAEVNLDEVKKNLAHVVEEAKANDPAELKKKIRELEQQIGSKKSPISDTQIEHMQQLQGEVRRLTGILGIASKEIQEYRDAIRRHTKSLDDFLVKKPEPEYGSTVIQQIQAVSHKPTFLKEKNPRELIENGDVDAGGQRILNVIATLNARGISVTREAVARWLGIHPNGGRYLTTLAALRSAGLLSERGYTLTEVGRATAVVGDTGVDAAMECLEGTRKKLLRTIVDANRSLNRQELAEILGIHPNGGRFLTDLAWLRDMGVIPDRGNIEPTQGLLN